MIVTLSPRTRVDTLIGGSADIAAVRAVEAAGEAESFAAAALAQKNLILNADFDFSASGTLSITYNANGTVNTISDGTTTKTCGYNAAGQLTTLT